MKLQYLLLLVILAGCGQKGPLYLPEKTTEEANTPTEVSQDESQPVDTNQNL